MANTISKNNNSVIRRNCGEGTHPSDLITAHHTNWRSNGAFKRHFLGFFFNFCFPCFFYFSEKEGIKEPSFKGGNT
jgi:hypothetical protein